MVATENGIKVTEKAKQRVLELMQEQGKADEYVDEVIDVVRRTLGRPVRGAARSG